MSTLRTSRRYLSLLAVALAVAAPAASASVPREPDRADSVGLSVAVPVAADRADRGGVATPLAAVPVAADAADRSAPAAPAGEPRSRHSVPVAADSGDRNAPVVADASGRDWRLVLGIAAALAAMLVLVICLAIPAYRRRSARLDHSQPAH